MCEVRGEVSISTAIKLNGQKQGAVIETHIGFVMKEVVTGCNTDIFKEKSLHGEREILNQNGGFTETLEIIYIRYHLRYMQVTVVLRHIPA